MLEKIEKEIKKKFGSIAKFERILGFKPKTLKHHIIVLIERLNQFNKILCKIGYKIKIEKLR